MIRVGLIGCGRWGRLILRDLRACGGEVHVAVPTEASRARAVAEGAASVVADLADLPELDAYVVATPTITHAAILERLLPAGRPIFVEKPMTADVGSARRLAAAAGDRLFVMDKWRYHPAIEAMRREIDEGRAGDILSIRLTRWGWGNPHGDVGPLWILAPHDLSILLHLTGRLPPVLAAIPVSVRDPSLGVTAHLGDADLSAVIDIGIASPDHRRRCLVIGNRATMELRDGYDERVFVRQGPPGGADAAERVIETPGAMPLLAEIRRFLEFVRGGPAPMSSAAEGLAIVERLAEIEAAAGLPPPLGRPSGSSRP